MRERDRDREKESKEQKGGVDKKDRESEHCPTFFSLQASPSQPGP